MPISIAVPPLDGSLTVFPGFVDFQARHNPGRPWVIYPSQESPTGSKDISYLEFSNATHRIAHDLRPGRNGPEQEVVAVVVHTDTLLYVVLLVSMIRAGMVVSMLSGSHHLVREFKLCIYSRFQYRLVTLTKLYVTC